MHEGYNLHLKKWLPLQRYQRGSIMIGAAGAMAAAGAGGIGGFVVLTAHSINDFAVSGTATAQIDFENDGELWGRRAILSDLQYTGEWWSDEPEASIGDSYAARHRSSGKIGTYSFEAAAAENWITITGTRSWGVSKSAPTGFKSCDATFECGPQPSGPADDTAFIELEADFDDSQQKEGDEMSVIDGLILLAILVVLARNFRKDKSDGRDILGGSGGGGGDTDRPGTHER